MTRFIFLVIAVGIASYIGKYLWPYLNKKGIVSDEAMQGQETKAIKITKYIILAIVLIFIGFCVYGLIIISR